MSAELARVDVQEGRLPSGPLPMIHHLWSGFPGCARHALPNKWPPMHLWSVKWDDVNCEGCLRYKPC